MKVEIKNLKSIRHAKVEGDRVLLYGPNGGGKSTLIHAVALILGAALGVRAHNENVIGEGDFRDDTYLRFEDFDVFEVRGRQLWWRGRAYPLAEPLKAAEFSLWHITESHFAIYGRVPQCLGAPIEGAPSAAGYSYSDLRVLCPAAAEAVRLPLFEVYYDVADVGDGEERWVPLSRLSYGQRRALVLLAALELGDYVLVENLEVGLHPDLLALVIDGVAASRARVIVETHSAVAVKLTMVHKIQAYYVDGSSRPIDTLDIGQFPREASVYSSLI